MFERSNTAAWPPTASQPGPTSANSGGNMHRPAAGADAAHLLPELASPKVIEILRWIGAGSRTSRLIAGFVSILLIGVLNYYTSPQLSSSLFYLLPILFVTHFGGRRAGILAAFLATGLWLLADTTGSSHYSDTRMPLINAVMRLGVFLIVVWLLYLMRILMDSLEQRVEQRTTQLRQEISERRDLEKRILEISEREQARMGQDLHDGLCQHLVGTAFSVNILQQTLAVAGHPEADSAAKVANLLDDAITQARRLTRGLYPVRIEDLGLATALQELMETMKGIFRVDCTFECQGEAVEPDQLVAVHLYRIAQEAVTNAMKHAQPGLVRVILNYSPAGIELRIRDNGKGMTPTPERGPHGMGLRIMEFRARMIDARFHIESRPDGGTEVICVNPAPKAGIRKA